MRLGARKGEGMGLGREREWGRSWEGSDGARKGKGMGKEGGRGWSREGSDGTRMAVGRSVMGLGREGDEARKGERMGGDGVDGSQERGRDRVRRKVMGIRTGLRGRRRRSSRRGGSEVRIKRGTGG